MATPSPSKRRRPKSLLREKVAAQYERHDSAAGRGSADWPAYQRMLDRVDAGYRG